ncbi:uncharacterized protein LOC124489768 [Dermatophagoides farinae]|uniref:Uncharacterized protein n=1 Tax=Dermatophagoides farinae TaxID=6954 RepID=A0A922I7N9_DERFA|nr:hypothetical protein DERF_006381 [Dermatophagoides farinae]
MYFVSKSVIFFAAIILIANYPSTVISGPTTEHPIVENEDDFGFDDVLNIFKNTGKLNAQIAKIIAETIRLLEIDDDHVLVRCAALKAKLMATEAAMNIIRCHKAERKDSFECKHLQRLVDNLKRELKYANCP